MAVKVAQSEISNGTISQNTCCKKYYLFGKFHTNAFMKLHNFIASLYYIANVYAIVQR